MQRATSLDTSARRHFLGGTGTWVHVPAPSQRPVHRSFESVVHTVPAASSRQRAEQQSPSAWLPSSQFSKGSITPFPHLVSKTGPEGQVGDVKVPLSSSSSPVPLYTNSGQSPVISPLTENAPVAGSTVPVAERRNF